MARPQNPQIRTKLRNQAIDYVLSHGLGDLTLRPLAKALKTNARMLVYHFGSREGLMREVLKGLREREDDRILSWFRSGKIASNSSAVLALVLEATQRSSRPARVAARLRTLCHCSARSAKIPRRFGRPTDVLAKPHRESGHFLQSRSCGSHAASRRHSGTPRWTCARQEIASRGRRHRAACSIRRMACRVNGMRVHEQHSKSNFSLLPDSGQTP